MFCIKGQFLGEKYVTILNSNKVKVYIIEECHLEKKKKKKKKRKVTFKSVGKMVSLVLMS